ncbi:hypothetical protein CC80DRAFT_236690 [Byssothecium circinans]|uniref:Uncharacterized protein n=1 Tax=Byssothecium circinans TaxID=147558 RepID=A0A6A5UBR4_9PLEO|nr:hypothetical protein CC80DRAFT_236690 [Byssothecium circinans]
MLSRSDRADEERTSPKRSGRPRQDNPRWHHSICNSFSLRATHSQNNRRRRAIDCGCAYRNLRSLSCTTLALAELCRALQFLVLASGSHWTVMVEEGMRVSGRVTTHVAHEEPSES